MLSLVGKSMHCSLRELDENWIPIRLKGCPTVAFGLTTTRFDAAYSLALFLALNTCGTFLLGGVPEGSATERAFGRMALAVILSTPIVLWGTRKTSAGPYLQDGFIILAIAGVVVAIVVS